MIDELRLIPKCTKIWSIKNQTNFILDDDEIVQIKHTCVGSDTVFVEIQQLLFNLP